MVFSSIIFLFYFFPFCLAGYFLTPTLALRNIFLLLASLLFYYWGEPRFLPILLVSITINFGIGLGLGHFANPARGWLLALGVTANLMLLTTVKYANFLTENLNLLLQPMGTSLPALNITLPLGISFFTFHAVSYLVDIYRRKVPPERNPLTAALYIAMFPQLVAGPIIRFQQIAGQLHHRRSTCGRASAGIRIFIIGLAQKALIANEVANLADTVFANTTASAAETWLGVIAYTLQIYFDFAGYSNMAIGLALIFGFTFPRNFRLPYRARSVTEFWRRWHISLSTWFRDYLYLPMGGNRHSQLRTYLNLMTVFLLCGLWHGASWNFIFWGFHHGAFLIVERAGFGIYLGRRSIWLQRSYTLLAVMTGWVWFRANDLPHALNIFRALIGSYSIDALNMQTHLALQPLTIMTLMAGAFFALKPDRKERLGRPSLWRLPLPAPLRRQALVAADTMTIFSLLLLSVLTVGSGAYNPFLYFRF
ncbi:MAG: MBOAT family O-acyltransferase [Candidatus Contendobacter sp.]|nr:MBOAT family O-acyltransferase [Candidatus Contendobacter sp.]